MIVVSGQVEDLLDLSVMRRMPHLDHKLLWQQVMLKVQRVRRKQAEKRLITQAFFVVTAAFVDRTSGLLTRQHLVLGGR